MCHGLTVGVFLHSRPMRFQIIFRRYIIRVNRNKAPDNLQKNRKLPLWNKINHLYQLAFHGHSNPPL